MPSNIQLQQEFEALIEELEKLKSINDITSTNSENAKKVIGEIESFVQSVETFRTSVANDYDQKKKDLEKTDAIIKESTNLLNDSVKNQPEKLKKLNNDFLKSCEKTLESLKVQLDKKVHQYISELKEVKTKIEEDIKNYNSEVDKKIDIHNKTIDTKVDNLTKEYIEQITLTNQNLSDSHEMLQDQLSDINKHNTTLQSSLKNLTILFIVAFVLCAAVLGYVFFKVA
jgi:vacuolar-type H+-ATPase subunit I/STV1